MSIFDKITVAEAEAPPHECSEETCKGGPFDCYDWSKGSKAVIASDGEQGVILQQVGGPLDYWINEACITDEFDGVEAGLWVWEGNIVNHISYHGEHDSELSGTFRKLDGDEIMNLRDGCDLWDIADFTRKGCSNRAENVEPGPTVETLRKLLQDTVDHHQHWSGDEHGEGIERRERLDKRLKDVGVG